MARKTFKRLAAGAAGLAVFAFLLGGWGVAAHADECDSANCMIQLQEANDPAYQAAIHSSYAPYDDSYPYSYNYYPYSSYPYYPYQNYSYQYQYRYWNQYPNPYPNQQLNRSYWMNGCLITTITVGGVVQTTQACGN